MLLKGTEILISHNSLSAMLSITCFKQANQNLDKSTQKLSDAGPQNINPMTFAG